MRTLAPRSLTLISFLLVAGLSSSAQISIPPSNTGEPLPVELANAAKVLVTAPVEISPDGLWAAYTISDPRRRKIQGRPSDLLSVFTCSGAPQGFADNDLLLTNTRTGQSINISAGKGANWGPSWSPDGKSLAFYSDRSGKANIWIWQKSTGRLRPLTTAVVHVRLRSEKIFWTPDSRHVITKVLGVGQSLNDCFDGKLGTRQLPPAARVVYDARNPGNELPPSTDLFLADLALIDTVTGKLDRIVRQQKITAYLVSPGGDKIAFITPTRNKPNDQFLLLYDLVVVSQAGRRLALVHDFSAGGVTLPASWSPDGRYLAYISERECNIWRVDGGQPLKVTDAPRSGFSQAPLWNQQNDTLYLPADGQIWRVSAADQKAIAITKHWDRQIKSMLSAREGNTFWSTHKENSLYVSTINAQTKQEGFYRVDLNNGAFVKLLEGDLSINANLAGVSARDEFIYGAQTAKREQNLWIANADFTVARQLTHINPAVERYAAGEARIIEYADADGKKLQATLLLPAHYRQEQRYPLVVWVYGGSMLSANVNRYGSAAIEQQNLQLLSARGYAVLLPDTPLRTGTPVQDLVKTVLPGVDKAIEKGVADPARLGVMGLSYGGYSTLALIAQTNRFKAAVMDVGFGNLSSSYGVLLKSGTPLSTGWAERGQGRMGGPPWEFPDRYIQNSPVFFLNKVETPLLITQGGMDVSPFQSDEVFVGLRRLGKQVVYVRYENEGHGIELYENRLDYWNRVIDWFESHLNPRAPSAPSVH